MSIVAGQIRRRVRAYQKVHGHRPHSIYMTELKFMYLLVEMMLAHPDGKAQQVAEVVGREGACAAAKRVLYMDMHLAVMPLSEAEAYDDDILATHRATKDTSFDAAKAKITMDGGDDSLFGRIFGEGGLFERIFGK